MSGRGIWRLAWVMTACAMGVCGAESVWAQFPILGVSNSLSGPTGERLPGTNMDPEHSARVELRVALGTTILPPLNPSYETNNPLVITGYVGQGMFVELEGRNTGRFAITVTNSFNTNYNHYVRVFNRSDVASSTHYLDSKVLSKQDISVQYNLKVDFSRATWKSLGAADRDQDGLTDTFEEETTGTNPDLWDTDADGFSDGFEYDHGMDPLVPYELIIGLEVEGEEAGTNLPPRNYWLTWNAGLNLAYQVDFAETLLDGGPAGQWRTVVTNLAATNTIAEVLVNTWVESLDVVAEPWRRGFFRVRTETPEEPPEP